MTTATWILVADSSRARLYSAPGLDQPWTLLKEYVHPESRVSEGGLTTDRAGRTYGSAGGGARSAMESKTSPKEVEFGNFALELANELHDGHGQQAFDRIVLVAPPHFLGLLRRAINGTVSKLIGESVNKDYMHLDDKALHRHLDPLIRAAAA